MGACCNFICVVIFTSLEVAVVVAAAIALGTPFWLDPDFSRNIPVITDGMTKPQWVDHAGFWQICGYRDFNQYLEDTSANYTKVEEYYTSIRNETEDNREFLERMSEDAKEQWDQARDYFSGKTDCSSKNLEEFWGRWWDYVNAARIISIIYVGFTVFKLISINCGICQRVKRRDFEDDKQSRGAAVPCGVFWALLQIACGVTVIGLMVAVAQYISNDTGEISDSFDDTMKYIGWSLWLWVASVGLGMITTFFLC